MLKSLIQFLGASVLFVLLGTTVSAVAGMTVNGKVVKYNTNDPIEDVEITIKDAYSLEKIGDGETDSNGEYEITTDESPEKFSMTYDAPNESSYNSAGRSYISRASDIMEVDTVGLISKEESDENDETLRYHQSSTAQYAEAGGDSDRLQSSIEWARQKFPNYSLTLQEWQKRAFKLRNIPIR